MRKTLKLALILLRTAGASFEVKIGKNDGKITSAVLWVITALSISVLMFPFYQMFASLFSIFSAGGNLAYATGLIITLGGIVVFMLAAFSTPALFYFSKDIESLLPMPLTSTQIIGAKFIVSLTFEFVGSVLVVVPMAAALWPYVGHAELVVNMVITFLTLPVLPLVYATLIAMLLMRFSNVMKNRERYNMVVSGLAIVLGIGVSFLSQRFIAVDQAQLMEFISGNQGAMNLLRSVFPNAIFAGMAAAGDGLQYQLLNLVIIAACLAVFFLLAKVLYFKGVIGISESAAPKKKMTSGEIGRAVVSRSAFAACLKKEFVQLFRSPVAFVNCVLMVYLMPVIIVATILVGGSSEQMAAALSQVNINFADPQTVSIMFTASAGVGFLFASMDLVSVTSITREGPNYFVMKFIPVSYHVQIIAKAASGLIIALPAVAIIFFGFGVLFAPPLHILAGMAALSVPGVVLLNNLGLILDLVHPKLDWENETHAVKQSINVIISMFGGMLLIVPVAAIGVGLSTVGSPLLTFAALFVIMVALAVGSHFLMLNTCDKKMVKLGE